MTLEKKLADVLKPRNYIPRFLKIRTKDAELVNLKPKPAQEKLLRIVEECKERNKPVRVVILKARQLGFSTFIEGLIFNDEATHPLKRGQIVAHEDRASQNLYTMYKTFYENLPEELTPMRKLSNSQEMLFENPTSDLDEKRKNPGLRSSITISTAKTINTGRSSTIHNFHASEVAFWQDAKTLMTSLLQCVPDKPNTMVFIETTANGVGGWFYDFWKAAENGENDYIPLFFPWFEDPEYTRPFESEEEKQDFIELVNTTIKNDKGEDVHTEEWELMHEHNLTYEQLNWRKYTIDNKCNKDLEMFHQEYPSTPDEAFIASGRPRFSIDSLKKYKKICKKKEPRIGNFEYSSSGVVFVENPKGFVALYNEPEKDRFYCIGADVAEGLAKGDYSVGFVGSDNLRIDCVWRGHIDPDLFGDELVKMAKYYNEAYIGVEANNHGLTTLKAIQKQDYYNIYFTKIYDRVMDKTTQKIGWYTTPRTKPLMINKLAEFIREMWIEVYFDTFVQECLTYVIEDNGATNAQEGCNDDTVMAMAILLQLILEGKGDNYVPVAPEETKKHGYRGDEPSYGDRDEEDKPEIAI